jgi:hypothetical protein
MSAKCNDFSGCNDFLYIVARKTAFRLFFGDLLLLFATTGGVKCHYMSLSRGFI